MTNRTSISDEQLIQFFLNGDQKALSTLIELYKDRIYTSIYGMVQDKNKAEDIFYVVFVHIIDNMIAGKAPEGGKFLPWAMKVAHGLCIQYNSTLVKTESHVEESENEEQEWNDSEIPLKSAKGYTHKKHGRIRRKSIVTGRIWLVWPGAFELKRNEMPSSGWIFIANTFGSISLSGPLSNSISGTWRN